MPTPATRKVLSVLLIAIILYHWRILIGHQFSLLTGYEGANQAYAWMTFVARSLHTGTSLLWDPYSFAGHPFVDEMQNGAFYPVNLLLALAPLNAKGVFSPALYHWLYAMTHVLAGYFMFLLLRELKLTVFGSFLASLGFALGGVMEHSGGWAHLFQSFVWFPLIFLFLLRAMKQTSPYIAVLYAATSGMGIALAILAGGLYSAIMQTILVVTMVGFSVFEGTLPRIRGALMVATAGFAAFCGSAAQLLPSLAAGAYTVRTVGSAMLPAGEKIPYQYINSGQWPHSFIGLFLAPLAYGGNLGAGEVASPYIGVLLFLLALIGVWKRWEQRWVRYLAGLTVGAFVYSMGSFSILHGVLYAVVPRLWMAREPTRILYLADFAVAALAAYGVDALFSEAATDWRNLLISLKWAAIVCGAALVGSAIFTKAEIGSWLTLSLVLMLVSAALIWRVARGDRSRGIRYLFAGLILFDLYAFNWDATNVMQEQVKNQDQLERLMSFQGAAEFLKKQPGPFRVQLLSDPISNIGDAYGVEAVWGAAATVVGNYWHYRDLNVWNTRYFIRPAATADAGAVYTDAVWKVYENPGVTPRAWLVHKVLVEQSAEKLEIAIRAPSFDLKNSAAVSKPLKSIPGGAADGSDRVDLRGYRATDPLVAVYSASPALLVFSEIYTPGWKATVNGSAAEIVQVDGVLRGIAVPAGYNRVEMHYRPEPVYVGGGLTIAAFLGLAAWWLVQRHRSYSGMI